MKTAICLGNGNLLINLDNRLNISDLFWPHVGEENHLAFNINEHFLFVNNVLTTFDSDWQISFSYKNDSLIVESLLVSKVFGLEIKIEDTVLHNKDIFLRSYTIKNIADNVQSVKLFLKNSFSIFESKIRNTAIWHPDSGSIVHYKKNRYIAVGSTKSLYQFNCAGPYDNNALGSFPNENGELNFNPVATGTVESCLSHSLIIKPKENFQKDFFILCGNSFLEVSQLANFVRKDPVEKTIKDQEAYWSNWITPLVNEKSLKIQSIFKEKDKGNKLFDLYKKSILILKSQIDNEGAIIAGNDSIYLKSGGTDSYSYFWPRDGAFAVETLIELGLKDYAERFFRYCNKVQTKEGYFLHKYYPNVTSGLASSWLPMIGENGFEQLAIQEDETALIITAFEKYYKKFKDIDFLNDMFTTLLKPASDFLANYVYGNELTKKDIDEYVTGFKNLKSNPTLDNFLDKSDLPKASFSIWETEHGIFTYTASSVYAGLKSASYLSSLVNEVDLARMYEHKAQKIKEAIFDQLINNSENSFYKGITCDSKHFACKKDNSSDASLLLLWKFGLVDVEEEVFKNTVTKIKNDLWVNTKIGGLARFKDDNYLRDDNNVIGNPWFITTLWLCQYYIKSGEKELAQKLLWWVIKHADSTGLIAEQADPNFGIGKSIKPLTWSQAELISTTNLFIKNYAD